MNQENGWMSWVNWPVTPRVVPSDSQVEAFQGKPFLCAAVGAARDHDIIADADNTALHFTAMTHPQAALE